MSKYFCAIIKNLSLAIASLEVHKTELKRHSADKRRTASCTPEAFYLQAELWNLTLAASRRRQQ